MESGKENYNLKNRVMRSIVKSVILLIVIFLGIVKSNDAQVRTTNQGKTILS